MQNYMAGIYYTNKNQKCGATLNNWSLSKPIPTKTFMNRPMTPAQASNPRDSVCRALTEPKFFVRSYIQKHTETKH